MINKREEKYKNGQIVPMNEPDYPPWDYGVRKGGRLNEPVMNQNLIDFKKVMDEYSIPFIFIFGSCLGLMRDIGKPWAHPEDTDTDVMCYAKDHHKMKPVIDKLRKIGFYVPEKNACPMRDHFITRWGEKIDIWWFEQIRSDYYYSSRVWYPVEFFVNPQIVRYLDMKWLVPNKPEEFLRRTYGKEWKTPKPEASYILRKK